VVGCGDEPKRVLQCTLGYGVRFPSHQCRLLSLFSNADKQTKPICFSGKGCSGVRGKAYIERRFIVGRGNMGVLFWPLSDIRRCRWNSSALLMCEALLLAPADIKTPTADRLTQAFSLGEMASVSWA
jgi:hypothetical protein